jgi:feruloyl esterase
MSILIRGLAVALLYGQSGGLAVGSRPAPQATAATQACDVTKLSSRAGDVTLRDAASVIAGSFVPPGSSSVLQTPAFCRVQAMARPAAASSIAFEVWIPQNWNSKVVVTGNGGYSNALSYRDMAYALSQGYAAVGGDTGHQTPTPDDLLWGVGQPERIIDWGSRSIHTIAMPARRIVEAVTGMAPRRAYFYGCSTGGHQAYAEMQRYPQDFDGVIAGAPGNNRVRLNAGFLWQFLANRRQDDPSPIIPASKLPVITKAVVASCDAIDGVPDGIVDDPRQCTWSPTSLLCAADDEPGCLTAPQVEALERMYAGARNSRTGEQIYPGWPRSSEALTVTASGAPAIGWQQYWGGADVRLRPRHRPR